MKMTVPIIGIKLNQTFPCFIIISKTIIFYLLFFFLRFKIRALTNLKMNNVIKIGHQICQFDKKYGLANSMLQFSQL